MKHTLLAGSAMAIALAVSGQAGAADWDVKVSGYMEQFFGYAHTNVRGLHDAQFNGVDEKSDTEVWFVPSIKLDNGIQFGARIELEGNSQSGDGRFPGDIDTIDKSYMLIKGAFGEINLGSDDSAGYKMSYAAPDVTFVNANSGSLTAFIPFSGTVGGSRSVFAGSDIFLGTLGSTFLETLENDHAQRISYYSPRLYGVQLGASYARDPVDDSNVQYNLRNEFTNFTDFGVNYVETLGGVDLAASARYGFATGDAAAKAAIGSQGTPHIYAAGLNLGYKGFTVGGSFAESDNTGPQDGQSYDAGISYTTGPWGFSFTYMHGRNVDDENFDFATGQAIGGSETLAQYLLGATYTLVEGVSLGAFAAYVNFKENIGDGGIGTVPNSVNGWVVGSGVRLAW